MKRISIPINDSSQLPDNIKDMIPLAEDGSIPALMGLGDFFETIGENKTNETAMDCYQTAVKLIKESHDCPKIECKELPCITKKDIQARIMKYRDSEQVTKSKHNKRGGIYMLYIDCFDDDKIIPFYIGKTNSFSKRLNQHVNGINKLASLTKKKYNCLIEEGEYDGMYLYCKIYSFLCRHNCTIDDVKMVILEDIEKEKERSMREDYYILQLKAPFFGFNQYLFQTHLAEHRSLNLLKDADDIEIITNIMKEEVAQIPILYQYGYCEFNTIMTLPIESSMCNSVLYEIDGLNEYMDVLRKSRYELIEHISKSRDLIIQAENEVKEGIVTVIPNPVADKARECLRKMFSDMIEPEILIEECVDAIFYPDSISSAKLWKEAKSKGYWEDPIYEFKKNYSDLYDICQNSPRPIPPADTFEKKIRLYYRINLQNIYRKYFLIETS